MILPRQYTHRPCQIALALAAFSAIGLAHTSFAQSNEYRLDSSGNLVQVRPATEATGDEAVIANARRELAEDRPSEAKSLLDPWIDANERTNNPLLAEAFLLRGDATTAMGDEYDALYDYERVIKEFPSTEAYILAVERELDIGVRYANGLSRKLFGVRILDATDIAEELLIRVQERLPGSRLAERAGIELADYYYRSHDLGLAVQAYDLFIQNYPRSQYLQKAMQRRIYATIGRFKGPRYDGSALIDAKLLIRRFANLYPQAAQEAGLDDGLITRLDESAGEEMMETARYYLAKDDDVSARYVLKRLIRMHPQTAAAANAMDMMKDRGWMQPADVKPTPDPFAAPAANVATPKPEPIDAKPAADAPAPTLVTPAAPATKSEEKPK
jgi:tetratricopeptide (TPR) repeat protein